MEINGHKYNASGFSYDFYQVPDFKGKSVTGIKGGDIHVVLDSSYDNSILETMLSDKTRKVPCVPWEEYEPCPVSGRIQFVQDDVHVFRELAFEEAYITRNLLSEENCRRRGNEAAFQQLSLFGDEMGSRRLYTENTKNHLNRKVGTI